MTGQLRTTLHDRADHLTAWDVDLDAIVRDGDRRVRRRRTAFAGGIAALVLVGGVSTLVSRGHTAHVPPADQDAKPLTYAVGSVIHTGSGTVDVGSKVVTLVRTHWGVVFSTPDRHLHLERDGRVQPITTFDGHPSVLADGSPRLFVSDDGMVTAWWDGERIQTWPGYRHGMVDALDKTNSFNARSPGLHQDPPRIEAVSDGHLWFFDGRDHWIAEVRPLTTTAGWKDTNPPGSGTVVDAAGDQILVKTSDGMAVTTANLLPEPVDKQGGWEPGGDLAGLSAQVKNVDDGDLAPDGRHWFTDDNDTAAVYDSATGRRQTLAHPGFEFAAPYEWLDDDTIAAIAVPKADQGGPISLLVCHVSTDACRVAVADIGSYGDIAIPNGQQVP